MTVTGDDCRMADTPEWPEPCQNGRRAIGPHGRLGARDSASGIGPPQVPSDKPEAPHPRHGSCGARALPSGGHYGFPKKKQRSTEQPSQTPLPLPSRYRHHEFLPEGM
jgi:hypothetical protein